MNCSTMAEEHTQRHVLLNSDAHPENKSTSSSPIWRLVARFFSSLWSLIELSRNSEVKHSGFRPNSLRLGSWYYWTFTSHHHAWQSENCLFFFCQLIVDFQICSEKNIQAVQISGIFLQNWALFGQWVGQFRDAANVTVENSRVAVTHKSLEANKTGLLRLSQGCEIVVDLNHEWKLNKIKQNISQDK